MGYHEGGVELVLPILIKVIFYYNGYLYMGVIPHFLWTILSQVASKVKGLYAF
jgi:hypothetical protein